MSSLRSLDVKDAFRDFEAASEKLRRAFEPFDDGKNQDPNDVAVATAAPRIFVEEAKARLDVALAIKRDRSSTRSTCAMVFFTLVIMLATGIQAWMALKGYDLAKSAKPVVCPETKQ